MNDLLACGCIVGKRQFSRWASKSLIYLPRGGKEMHAEHC